MLDGWNEGEQLGVDDGLWLGATVGCRVGELLGNRDGVDEG